VLPGVGVAQERCPTNSSAARSSNYPEKYRRAGQSGADAKVVAAIAELHRVAGARKGFHKHGTKELVTAYVIRHTREVKKTKGGRGNAGMSLKRIIVLGCAEEQGRVSQTPPPRYCPLDRRKWRS